MTISDPHSLFDEDKRLRTGKQVDVFWSKAGFNYRGHGQIVKVRSCSVTVSLGEKISYGEGYAAGSLVTVPRIVDAAQWSSHNCVRLPVKACRSYRIGIAG